MYFSLVIISNVACAQRSEIDRGRARDLIRRNILGGDYRFSIEDPRAYQYGSVHVDGPNGGMLYRFKSDPDTLKWIIKLKRLQENVIGSSTELRIDFLGETPKWWKPWEVDPSAVYYITENIPTGGKRRFIVIYDGLSSVIYIVEHYSEMRGV